jgi:hypothetical protein
MQFLSNNDGVEIGLAAADIQKLTQESMVHGSIDLPGWPILYRIASADATGWDVHFDGHALVVNVPRVHLDGWLGGEVAQLETQAGNLRVVLAKL